MDLDLDDLISTDATNTAKAGIKFQPKGKPKPKPKPNPKPEPKPNAQPEPNSTPTPSTQFVEVAATTEEQDINDANQIIADILCSLQPTMEKSHEENAESSHTSESPNNSLSEFTTAENLPTCSDSPTVDVSVDGKLDAGPTEPELINNIDASTNLESIAELDPLTGEEATISNDNEGFQTGNLSPGSKEAENFLFWEPLDNLAQSITGPGPRVGKFKPKPKAQSRKMDQIANNPDQDVGPVPHGEDIRSVPSQTDFMETEPIPSYTPDEILGTSSMGITDSVATETISDYHVNEEAINGTEISQVESVNEAGRSSKRLTQANKPLRLIDEENVGIEDNNNDDEYVPETESLTEKKERKSKSKSKKPLNEDKKPVRKRKKDKEVPNDLAEVPKKKFSHSTRRNKRPANPELLKIPEDEFELHMHSIPLNELIRLREHKERIEQKEASLLVDAADKSDHAQNATYYNYGTHMKIAPRMKWTKADTEVFYQAIQQFGTDFSMLKECFPGRTREQMRAKYKKEHKQNRLRIESALSNRAKGHDYFELVIQQLKQAQGEDSENDDSVSLAGEEDEVVATDINEGGDGDAGLQKEVKDMKPDAPAAAGAESPTKSDDDDEEDDLWSQYKSEI